MFITHRLAVCAARSHGQVKSSSCRRRGVRVHAETMPRSLTSDVPREPIQVRLSPGGTMPGCGSRWLYELNQPRTVRFDSSSGLFWTGLDTLWCFEF